MELSSRAKIQDDNGNDDHKFIRPDRRVWARGYTEGALKVIKRLNTAVTPVLA
jgi:hypothetical protein